MDNNLAIEKACNKIIRISILIMAFLMPLFFLPLTSDYFDFNKQAILIALSFISIFAWILKTIISGKVKIRKNLTITLAGIFLFFISLSGIFSMDRYGSFWGWPLIDSKSVITMLSLGIVAFLIICVFEKKDIYILLKTFIFSLVIASIISLVLIIFKGLNIGVIDSIGGPGALGVLLASFLPMLIVLAMLSKTKIRLFYFLGIVTFGLNFFLINYTIVWWVVLASFVAFMICSIFKKDFLNVKWLSLPIFFIVISIFFLLLHPTIKWLPNAGQEILLSQKAGFEVAVNSLKSNPVLGSGNGTFAYDYLKNKNREISSTNLWNIVLVESSSEILTLLPTIGILGTLLFLAFIVSSLITGARSIFWEKNGDQDRTLLLMTIFTSLFSLFVSSFLYNFNIALSFSLFLSVSTILGLVLEGKKDYTFRQNSFKMLTIIFLGTVIFIFGVGLLFMEGQRYYAEVMYKKGMNELSKGDIDKGILKLEAAVSANSSADLYFRQLGQVYLAKLQKDIYNAKMTEAEKSSAVQFFSTNSINAAKISTDLCPSNSKNWAIRGFIYQNYIGFSDDMGQWAETSYQKAIELDPYNPYLNSQLGILYYQKKDYSNAISQLKKAKDLNLGYSLPIYYLGLSFDAAGQKENALQEFKLLSQLNPDNQEIKKILDNLNNGNSALSGVSQPINESIEGSPLNIEEESTDKKIK